MPKTQRKLTTIYTSLEESDCDIFDAIARTNGLSRSELARKALRFYVDHEQQLVSNSIETRLRNLISDVVAGTQKESQLPDTAQNRKSDGTLNLGPYPLLQSAETQNFDIELQISSDSVTENDYPDDQETLMPAAENPAGDGTTSHVEHQVHEILERLTQIEAREMPSSEVKSRLEEIIINAIDSKMQEAFGIQSGSNLEEVIARVLKDHVPDALNIQRKELEQSISRVLENQARQTFGIQAGNNLEQVIVRVLKDQVPEALNIERKVFEQSISRVLKEQVPEALNIQRGELEEIVGRVLEIQMGQSLGLQPGSNLEEMLNRIIESQMLKSVIPVLKDGVSDARSVELIDKARAEIVSMASEIGTLIVRIGVNDESLQGQIRQLEARAEQTLRRVLDISSEPTLGAEPGGNLEQVISRVLGTELEKVVSRVLETELQKVLRTELERNGSQLPVAELINGLQQDLSLMESRLGTLVSRMAVDASVIFLLVWNSQPSDRPKSYQDVHEKAVKRISRWIGELGMDLELESQTVA